MKRALTLMIFLLGLSSNAHAQIGNFFVFPQVADGVFPDGQSYRSTLMIQDALLSSPATCTLRLYGMTTRLGNTTGNSFSLTVPVDGWLQVKTPGTQAFQQGYGTLTCSGYVYANMLYSYYSGATKLSEAAVFGVDPSYSFKLIADQTEGARLGLAIANNTDISKRYTVEAKTEAGAIVGSAIVQIAGRSSVARFLDDLIPATRNRILEATVAEDSTFSFDNAVIGIKMTGTVLATIPAN